MCGSCGPMPAVETKAARQVRLFVERRPGSELEDMLLACFDQLDETDRAEMSAAWLTALQLEQTDDPDVVA